MKRLFILFLAVLLNGALSAQSAATVTIKKCQDFTITGSGSSDTWRNTDWIKLVPQGSDYIDYETKAKVLYSLTGIYFLFRCQDEKLTTTMQADNMNLWEEDVVEVFLWTSEDFPVYFEYEISPMDFELPIMVPNYKGKFLGWLPWKYGGDRRVIHATSVEGGVKRSSSTVTAWIAEFFIPYKLLNPIPQVPPFSGTKWRANMYRIDHDKGVSHFAWQKTTGSFHEYSSFGTFVFE